jgi:lipopolysaccharide transport system ATP-binding protein
MSSDLTAPGAPAIRARELAKRYVLGGTGWDPFASFRDRIADVVGAPSRWARSAFRKGGGPRRRSPDHIWSLSDVSFDIEHGDVVGVIGRNGAGKTTLLKILSRITEPTRGWAEIRGRVGSLLEVGTGFHPELTGRENIYLNGAMLGMRKVEIDRRFDEIVAFAELERFLDTPVKHYSSGMYVRLGFSVAAHLEPEILLVDEVLAVGDVAFQKKCLGKMDEAAGAGRTVLFVSHNMATIQALCRRGIYLRDGRVEMDGGIDEAVDAYLRSIEHAAVQDLTHRTDRRGGQLVRLTRVDIHGPGGASSRAAVGRPASFEFWLEGRGPQTICQFTIFNHLGHAVTTLSSSVAGPEDATGVSAEEPWTCRIDELSLVPGRYRIDVKVRADGKTQDHLEGAAFFDVEEGTLRGRPVATGALKGDMVLPHRWTIPPR